MPITPTNLTKNAITPSFVSKGIGAYWGDTIATWGDSAYGWGDVEIYTNLSKNSISPTNATKN